MINNKSLKRELSTFLIMFIFLFSLIQFSNHSFNQKDENLKDISNKTIKNDDEYSDPQQSSSLNEWWNPYYRYRAQLNITNLLSRNLPLGYSVKLILNTKDLIMSQKLRVDGNDLRIIWFNTSNGSWKELDRLNETNFNNQETEIWFKTQVIIEAQMLDTSYFLYYGNPKAENPPSNAKNVYEIYDNFNQNDGPAEGWKVIQGDGWSVVNNEYNENEAQVDRRTILNGIKIKNTCIEVQVKHSGSGSVFGGGIMFRYINDKRYYTAGLGFYGYKVGLGSQNKNDFPEEINGIGNEGELEKDRGYNLRIYAFNKRLAVYLDNDKQFEVLNEDHTILGSVGLMTWTASLDVYFDNFKLRTFLGEDPLITLNKEETYCAKINWVSESNNPLELGQTVIITANITDIIGIKSVLIRIDNTFHSMSHIGNNIYEFKLWTPNSVGDFPYTIYAQNNIGNWISHNGLLKVVDTTPPEYYALKESSDPLELGETEIISVNITDLNGISRVLIRIDNIWYSMKNNYGDQWQYDSWIPKKLGLHQYIIFVEDKGGNYKYIYESIEVIDTTPPDYSDLIESADPLELGENEIISIKAKDLSGINQVLIEYGGGNHSLAPVGENKWEFNSWIPDKTGIHDYKIYLEDKNGNWNSIKNFIEVVDTIPPEIHDIIESADPLELGDNEIITVYLKDLSGVKKVQIKYNNNWYPMININQYIWKYDSWIPNSVGEHIYTLLIEDNNGNSRTFTGSIEVVDTTPPDYSDLIENADPLELGENEIISIKAKDLSGINQILIEIDGINYTMKNIGKDKWEFNSWFPVCTGEYDYKIYIGDKIGNWNSVKASIRVVDTTSPAYFDLTESSDPLELGETEIITISAKDLSGISRVCIFIKGLWYDLKKITNEKWKFDSWIPEIAGQNDYTIYIHDYNDNWNSISGSIKVIDTKPPEYSDLIENNDPIEIGEYIIISIQLIDFSGIKQSIIEFEGSNHSMNYKGNSIWQYNSWKPMKIGNYTYIIYFEDNNNNCDFLIGNITVIESSSNPSPVEENTGSSQGDGGSANNDQKMSSFFANPLFLVFLIAIIGASSIATTAIIIKKSKKKNNLKSKKVISKITSKKPFMSEIDALLLEREQLDKDIQILTKSGDYLKIADRYKRCEVICGELFKLGLKEEANKAKYYANLSSEALSIDNTLSISFSCINHLMSEYGNEIGLWYYSSPKIYDNHEKAVDGLILNDNEFLKKRFTILKDSHDLTKELSLDLNRFTNIKAILFKFTNDVSEDNLISLSEIFEISNCLLFIVGLKWPLYQYTRSIIIPYNDKIKYPENTFVINHELFVELMGLNGKFLERVEKIIELNNQMNIISLKKIYNNHKAVIHDTEDLRDDLIEKKLIKEELSEYFSINYE